MDDSDLGATSLTQRLVLLGVAEHAVGQRTPIHSADVEDACLRHLEAVEADVLGSISEGDVMRALNELDAEGFLELVDVEDASVVGKGRPRYALRVDPDALFDELAADDRIKHVVERIRDSS